MSTAKTCVVILTHTAPSGQTVVDVVGPYPSVADAWRAADDLEFVYSARPHRLDGVATSTRADPREVRQVRL